MNKKKNRKIFHKFIDIYSVKLLLSKAKKTTMRKYKIFGRLFLLSESYLYL